MTHKFLTCAPGGMGDDCGFHSGHFEPGAFEVFESRFRRQCDKCMVRAE